MPPRTEQDLLDQTIQLAQLQGWLVHHDRPARTATGWRTAVQGDAGFPDLLLVRDGTVLFWELKSPTGRVTSAQQRWLRHLEGQVLRPDDWDWMRATLDVRGAQRHADCLTGRPEGPGVPGNDNGPQNRSQHAEQCTCWHPLDRTS